MNWTCLDPGHPSETSDGTSANGAQELDINWAVTERLPQLLATQQGGLVQVKKTREVKNQRTTNRRRAEIANELPAALFLRLHCDYGSGSGYTLYYADRPGRTQGVTGPSPDIIAASSAAAQAVREGMRGVLGQALRDNGIRGESQTAVGARQGALTGSIFCSVPAVTVEMVFLNNPQDAAFIKSNEGQVLMAQALAAGVMAYVNHSPGPTAQLSGRRGWA